MTPLPHLHIVERWHRTPATVERTHGRSPMQFLRGPVGPLHFLHIMEMHHRTTTVVEDGKVRTSILGTRVTPLPHFHIMEGQPRIPATAEQTHGSAPMQFLHRPVRPRHLLHTMEVHHRITTAVEDGRVPIQFPCTRMTLLHHLHIVEGWHRIPATQEEWGSHGHCRAEATHHCAMATAHSRRSTRTTPRISSMAKVAVSSGSQLWATTW